MEKDTKPEKFMSRMGAVSPIARNSTCDFAPATLDTVQVPDFTTSEMVAYLMPATLLAVLTVLMPQNPQDGQIVNLSSSKAITLLNIGGATLVGAVTALLAGGFVRYAYNAVDSKWYRVA